MKLTEHIKKKKANKTIENYSKLFFKKIDRNKNILIDAFVNYYGEEYRNIIIERMNNTYFYTFISDITIKELNKLISANFINNTNIVNNIKKILNYYDKNHITAKFYYNNRDVQAESTKKYTAEYFSNNKNITGGHLLGMSNNNVQSSLIFLSFHNCFCDETALIHELNHAIRSSFLASYTEKNGKNRMIEKSGIVTNGTSNEGMEIEEILLHRATLEILNIFHDLNGCITMQPTIHLISNYEKMFPLIENFYQKYKELLKKAAITDNRNILFSEIDKEKYEEFKRIICEQFSIIYDNNNLSDKVIDYVKKLVDQIGKKENEKENIHEFIEELKAKGKTIKFLNDNIQDNNENKSKQR